MVKAFNMTFGQDECDVEAWGRMCVLVDMENIPEDLEARRLVNTTEFLFFLAGVILSSIFNHFSSFSQEVADSGLDFFMEDESWSMIGYD